jgi:hypothetical protein
MIGSNFILNNVKFYVRGNGNKIRIKEGVKFKIGGSIWVEDDNCELLMEKNTSIEDCHFAITESNSKIEIGEDCMFAYDIDLRTGDSHSVINSNTVEPCEKHKNRKTCLDCISCNNFERCYNYG